MLHGPKHTQRLAAKLRREMTLPEILLWQALRQRPGKLKFRHQHPAGSFVLDFFCAKHRLVVEIDGEVHSRADHPARDEARDAWLVSHDVRVLRSPATAILSDLDSVLRHIVDIAIGPRG